MIAAVTIRGQVTARKTVKKTLKLLKMNKKFSLRIFEDEKYLSMLKKAQNYVMYGEISKELKEEIVKKFGEKYVYHIHPPIGGFKKSIKQNYPAGETGRRNKQDMEYYIRRMIA